MIKLALKRFFRINNGHPRIFGLDVLRAFAILFVLFGHSSILTPTHYKPIISQITLDGVALFFVLSGFLIGGILIKSLEKEKASLKNLFVFWTRRWLRTIPIYFILLTFVILYYNYLKPHKLPLEWYRYFFFIQNFNYPLPPFFGESWSLSIEEWFYLIVPIILYTTVRFIKGAFKKKLLVIILLVIILIIGYRLYLYQTTPFNSFAEVNLKILRQVITRLDSIMFGVLAAYFAHFFPTLWNKKSLYLCLLGVILLYALKFFNDNNISEYRVVFVPVFKSICVVMMLPFLSTWKTTRHKTISRVITFISLISYSMYLINRTIVIDILIKFGLHDNLIGSHEFSYYWGVDYFLFWFFSLSIAYILYISIEVPFMKLRNIKNKTNN